MLPQGRDYLARGSVGSRWRRYLPRHLTSAHEVVAREFFRNQSPPRRIVPRLHLRPRVALASTKQARA